LNTKHFKDKLEVNAISIMTPLVDYIPDSEGLISYQARVSNEGTQLEFETADRLLAYCARNGHWSVFDMSNLILEIKAPRDISRQILRHSSAKFQEFSQRYADVTDGMFCLRDLRKQDTKNRQNSIAGAFTAEEEAEWFADQQELLDLVQSKVKKWRSREAAKECTRVFMPEGLTMSKMYMNATVRTWIHYTGLRKKRGETQDEHCDVADKCREYLLQHFPSLCKVLENNKE
jgi:thymidylate synthase (FAD)